MKLLLPLFLLISSTSALVCYNDTSANSYVHTDAKSNCTSDSTKYCFKDTNKNDNDKSVSASWGCADECKASSTHKNGLENHHYCCTKDYCNIAVHASIFGFVAVFIFQLFR
ncbi:unnamed protein product, partial [Mesorhabditis spiculigera]